MLYKNDSQSINGLIDKYVTYCPEWEECFESCPVCEMEDPDCFYVDGRDECIGCSGCIQKVETLKGRVDKNE